jgi:hypothetical protein
MIQPSVELFLLASMAGQCLKCGGLEQMANYHPANPQAKQQGGFEPVETLGRKKVFPKPTINS